VIRSVLVVAGSDSGGGAGIQADLATVHALGAWATTAITCLTAQNPDQVTRVDATDPAMVAEQIATVCRRLPPAAVKIGMTYSAPIIEAIAAALAEHAPDAPVVLDPVMRATSEASLLQPGGEEALAEHLLPVAQVVTPNLAEAAVLARCDAIDSPHGMEAAARLIAGRTPATVVVKGGHLDDEATDLVLHQGQIHLLRGERVAVGSTHGTGCSLSSAVAAGLANGLGVLAALRQAKAYVTSLLRWQVEIGPDGPHGLGVVHPGGTWKLRLDRGEAS
jgi:hydroxymethylpyrimidine/phosphomethylpyrimidine kinase